MWFYAIAAGVVVAAAAAVLAGRAYRMDRPALASFAEAVPLPVLGAAVLAALALAHHHGLWPLAGTLLACGAWMAVISVTGPLAGRARRAGRPALGSFAESASFPLSVAFFLFALGLALGYVDWAMLITFPAGYAAWAILRTLRNRRSNA
jgi:hypothetical protein